MKKSKLYVGLSLPMMLMLLVLSLIACVQKPVIIQESSLVVRILKGEPAPADGYLLSERALADLMECCEFKM